MNSIRKAIRETYISINTERKKLLHIDYKLDHIETFIPPYSYYFNTNLVHKC